MAHTPSSAFRVLIAGGGVAAIELAAAVHEAAAERVHLTLLSPEENFVYRPGAAAARPASASREPVALMRIADALGADLISDHLQWVDREAGAAHTRTGRRVTFDALAVCIGAEARPAYPCAISLTGRPSEPLTHLVARIADGACRRLAFLIPERQGWPLPLYELAMAVATMAHRGPDLELTFVTSEAEPLGVFGEPAAETMRALLTGRGIELITGARCRVPAADRVIVTGDRELEVDAVIALPELYGPHLRGLPCAANGFIPVDRFCRVRGVRGVYAAGDATDFPVKHGGIAAQQADVAALAIAARAGADVLPRPFHARLEGILATGGKPAYLSAWLAGGRPFGSEVSEDPRATSHPKVIAAHLEPWLARAGG